MKNDTRKNAMEYAVDRITMAVEADRRNDAANRNHIVSQLRGDSDLPKRSLETLLKNAGLAK